MSSAKPFTFPFISSKLQQQQSSEATPAAPRTPTTPPPLPPPLRPILTHLNADTSWLLLLPYPTDINNNINNNNNTSSKSKKKRYFRILIDPWLSGPQSDVFSWFSTQWHAIPPSLGSIKDVKRFISSIDGEEEEEGRGGGNIDAVIISHEFTDHCHKATLLEVDKNVPVFANDKAAELIRGWGHFERVVEVRKFRLPAAVGAGWDWRSEGRYLEEEEEEEEGGLLLLPEWIGMVRIESAGNALYYHSSVMVIWDGGGGGGGGDGEAEGILYTPHGVLESALKGIENARPKITVTGLMHGLHDVKLGLVKYIHKQLNLGMKNAVEVVRGLNGGGGVKYWVGTHDERKVAGGVVGRMLWRKAWTGEDVEGCCACSSYVELGNGESLVLL